MKILLVGGAVRDMILGLEIKDRDWLVVGGNQDFFIKEGYQQVGNDFPVFLHPETREEYALARKERKVGAGYNGFEFDFSPEVTIEEDLFRRDLTINAIAFDENEGFIDPYNGIKDLKDKKLRHVSNHFSEDPVRVLRVARFMARYSCLGFTVADETLDLMKKIGESGELNNLTSERVWLELEKVFKEPNPSKFFETLKKANVLSYIFPEIDNLFGVPQTAKYHPEIDTGIHIMMVLEQAKKLSGKTDVMFAALTHDLGKYLTHLDPNIEEGKHAQHEIRGLPLVEEMCDRLKVPNPVRKLAMFTSMYHTHCHKAYELTSKSMYTLYKKSDFKRNPDFLENFFIACKADARGRLGFENVEYNQPNYIKNILNELIKADIPKNLVEEGFKGSDLGERIKLQELEYLNHLIKNPENKLNDMADKNLNFFVNIKNQKSEDILSKLNEIGFFGHIDYKYKKIINKMKENNKEIDLDFFNKTKEGFNKISIEELKERVNHYSEIGVLLKEERLKVINNLKSNKKKYSINKCK